MARLFLCILLLITLSACGTTFEVGIERTPTPNMAVIGTVSALEANSLTQATQIATLSTQVATGGTGTTAPAPPVVPNGSDLGKVTYLLGGDIWVQPLPNGTPRRLTNDGRNRTPTWSPSGEWLAFRKEGEVWVMKTDGGSVRQVVDAQEFAWSPAEDRLAYSHGEYGALLLIPATALPNTGAAGEGLLLYEGQNDEDGFTEIATPVWNYSGTEIAFSTFYRRHADWVPQNPTLWYVRADGGEESQALFALEEEYTTLGVVGWVPQENAVLFIRNQDASDHYDTPLERISLDDDEPSEIFDAVLPYSDFLVGVPDADMMIAVAGSGKATYENKRLALLDSEPTYAYYVTDENSVALYPAFDSTTGRVAYTAMSANAGLEDRHIWIAAADSAGTMTFQQITNDPDYRDEHPIWSSDGQFLLFPRMNRDGLVSLWLVNPTDGKPHLVIPEITPAPRWWGDDGYIAWGDLYDWHK